MNKSSPRVKRFDDVDSDSDFEFDEAPPRKLMPTLSFKSVTATDDSDSIAFEFDNDRSQHTDTTAAPADSRPSESAPPTAHPAPSPTAAPKLPFSVTDTQSTPLSETERPLQQRNSSSPAFQVSPTPMKRPSPANVPFQPTPLVKRGEGPVSPPTMAFSHVAADTLRADAAQGLDDAQEDQASDDFVQHVLPLPPRQAAATAPRPPVPGTSKMWADSISDVTETSRLRTSVADNATDELLVRAQLRLEERRRMNLTSQRGSRQLSPIRGSATPPMKAMFRESAPLHSMNSISPSASADPRIRRLLQENARLQDEVAFLGRENQKMRAAQSSAEASEAVRLQLTVDMLRKELENQQLGLQRTLDANAAEMKEAQRQMEEAAEQCEGFQSAAEQYKQLYSGKQREMEKVKTQLQSLLYDINAMEQRQRSMEAECADKVASERERAERAVTLVEEVKRQRDHLQFLNTQLQNEVAVAVEAKRQAVDQAAGANDSARRDRAEYEQRIAQLQEDMAQMKKALADKLRAQEAQLREAQQAQAVLQERMKEQVEEHQREAERSRRTLEETREDHRRVLQQEKMRRAEIEERLCRQEEEGRSAQLRYTASLSAEAESRVRKLREEMQAERLAKEVAEREAARLATEVEQLRESVSYYQLESQRMSASFAQSEQLREKAEWQCVSLTHTLEDMMAQEEAHAREIRQLQETVAASTPWGAGIAVSGGADAAGIVSDLQQLSDENERLTSECSRIASERDTLIEENGRIAEELLRWKREVRQYVASHARSTSSQRGPVTAVPTG
ncbi:hypothetical protein LSCM1_01316 [Leishmania martiniquensis]|uniref:Uncharacterized protein n=1 Tax=Leishmania martiniquensis TaxID=1580590 RepID=A0A836GWV2_9TRYP|nr:hypothetical protein LSCM1_01316 [Leishmania martiniquensis]